MYDCITNLCRTQAEVIVNYVNPNARGIGQEEVMHKKHKKLELGGGWSYDHSAEYP
jgi:hypothetical protein